ncbi:MAG: nucleoside-triphosphatase [Clostridiales Family XIII bacterium]|jgi:nucleoside-triphosphatase|nr:nucleoside-triphosphatase [Clostridiales Family XIII bacterium]
MNAEKRHIFLMGERGVGKSTAIRALTGRLLSRGVTCGGFETTAGPETAPGRDAVYMLPYRADAEARTLSEDRIVATRDRIGSRYESRPAVFDALGADFLRRAAHCDLIVMDELGFMEAEAHIFQDAVLSLLDGARSVLGVVKPPSASKGLAFPERVRTHPAVLLFPLTRENRDAAPARLWSLLAPRLNAFD